ncbi:MAG: alpha/beta fold hydrolase [Actinobacteria bacterium]|nr:alpha/beta fold hydrolase [Actinomycetota bacterium]
MIIQYPIEAGGVVLRVLEAGTGDRSMLMLHGVGARADRWRSNLEGLAAAGYHVYAIDLPGHGLSEKGAKFDHSVGAYSRVVRAFAREIADNDLILVGTSLGGHVSAAVACEEQDLAKGIVLVGTLGFVPLGQDVRASLARLVQETSIEGIRSKLQAVLEDQSLITEELVLEEFRINNSPGAKEAFARIATYFRDHIDDDLIAADMVAKCAGLPTLLVWGREDRAVPLSVGLTVRKILPDSTLAILDKTAHAPYYERPEAFQGVVLAFLADQLGERPVPGIELI